MVIKQRSILFSLTAYGTRKTGQALSIFLTSTPICDIGLSLIFCSDHGLLENLNFKTCFKIFKNISNLHR